MNNIHIHRRFVGANSNGMKTLDEKYTREINPEVHTENLIKCSLGLSSFDEFPKLICNDITIEASSNKFSDLDGFPTVQNDILKSLYDPGLVLNFSDNPLTTLKGGPKHCSLFIVDECKSLSSLEHMPCCSKLAIRYCTGIKNLNGINFNETDGITIDANSSGLTSLEGCPEKVRVLCLLGCENFKSFEGFPSKGINKLHFTMFKGSLMQLHELMYDRQLIRHIICHTPDSFVQQSNKQIFAMSSLENSPFCVRDPFEFQEKCIANGLEEFL